MGDNDQITYNPADNGKHAEVMEEELNLIDPGLGKRLIADSLRTLATVLVTSYGHAGKKFTRSDYLAEMLWQGVIEGEIQFADGKSFNIKDEKDGTRIWLDLVKFLAGHLDGPMGNGAQFNGVNIFKVYKGIDTDQV
jgi:hypothetical protein